jgi:hypothetical protein
VINSPKRPALWDRFTRTLLPTHGARANAAEALAWERDERRRRAEGTAALAVPMSPPRPRGPVAGENW